MIFDARSKAARDYWLERMGGVHDAGSLPLDRKRSKIRLSRRRSMPCVIGSELTASILALCGDSDLLLYATVSSSIVTCLRRYGATERVVFGSPAVGGGGGMVPIAIEPRADATFEDLLVSTRETLSEAYSHQGYPLDRLAADLGIERVENREPFFDVVIVLDGFHAGLPDLANDVTVFVERRNGQLGCRIDYNHRLHHEDTVRRFWGHVTTLLASGLTDPRRRIDELELLTVDEHEQVRQRMRSATTVAEPGPEHIYGMFATQAATTPGAVAISHADGVITYGELRDRAAALAGAATLAGAAAGDIVAVCLDASVDFVVSALAVLSTGAAYLPVDPALPAARVATMSAVARPVLAIARPESRPLIGDISVVISPAAVATPRQPAEVAGDAAAYVMFTSGSTGQPKGVQMPHRALVNLIRWQHRSSGPEVSAGRTLLRTAPCFDVSFQEIFSTLCCGGTVVIAPPEAQHDVAVLADAIVEHAVQRVFLPFVALQLLAREAIRRELRMPELREVITAGEQLKITPSLVEFFRRHPDCSLQNQYGPTETHVVTAHRLTGPPTQWEPLPPIGTPIDHVSAVVTDHLGRPVPVGVPGELYVGGIALADGYVDQPARTAERFATGPVNEARMFRTGDLARLRADGSIDYLGRGDRQVKIRGHRVELEEIEAVLLRHPTVAQSAVVGRVDDSGTTHLAAYVVPTSAYPGESALRGHLAEHLPAYMLPRWITTIAELPLTPTGKVDHSAMPEPDRSGGSQPMGFVAPRLDAEAVLARIWAEVLELERVSVTADFLELGGDSILAMQAVALAAERGLCLRVRDFFLHPTIAEQASLAPQDAHRPDARPVDIRSAPLTPVERWFFDFGVPDPNLWNISVLLEVEQALDPVELERALVAIAEHHEALRFTFADGPDGRSQFPVAGEQAVSVHEVDLRGTAAGELATAIRAVTEEVQGSIDIRTGPLLSAASIRLDDGLPARLLLVAHHLVTDGVSWRILLHDLQTAYQQLLGDEAISLPARTTSYQEWARLLVDHARSQAVRAELDYWMGAGAGGFRPLPRDRQTGAGTGAEGSSRRCEVSLNEAATAALMHEVPGAYRARIDEVLLSALLTACCAWTGDRSLLIELEGHGREEVIEAVDLSRTIGWFSTMFPVGLTMPTDDDADGPGPVVRAVKQRLREVPNRGIGYGLLLLLSEDESVRDRLAAQPRPEVRFNYLGRFDGLFGGASMFRPAPEPIARMVDPNARRPMPLSVQGQIVGSRLTMTFDYSEELHDESTIEHLARGFLTALQRIIGEAGALDGAELVPSDFPGAGLDEADLRTLLGQVAEARGGGI